MSQFQFNAIFVLYHFCGISCLPPFSSLSLLSFFLFFLLTKWVMSIWVWSRRKNNNRFGKKVTPFFDFFLFLLNLFLQSVWDSKDEITQETIEVSQEEYQSQFAATSEAHQEALNNPQQQDDEEEGGGFEEQNIILRLPHQSQPTIPQLLEKLQISANPNQCLDISAQNFDSFNSTAHSLCAAFNSSDWTRDDLDEQTAARLFANFPLIVIRNIDKRFFFGVFVCVVGLNCLIFFFSFFLSLFFLERKLLWNLFFTSFTPLQSSKNKK